jgi:hypothetical protein
MIMAPHGTATLDKLYLEWSQFTSARTAREIEALALLSRLDREGGLGLGVHQQIKAMIERLEVPR